MMVRLQALDDGGDELVGVAFIRFTQTDGEKAPADWV